MYNIIFRTDELETVHNADVDLIKYKNFIIWPQAYCKIDESRGQLGRGFIRCYAPISHRPEHHNETIQKLGFEPVKGNSRIFAINTTECELVTSQGENIPKNYRTELSVDRSLSDEMVPTNVPIQVDSNSSSSLIWSNTNIRIDTVIMA